MITSLMWTRQTASLVDSRMCEGGCPNIQLNPKEVTSNAKVEANATTKSARKGVRVGEQGTSAERGSNQRPDFSVSRPSRRRNRRHSSYSVGSRERTTKTRGKPSHSVDWLLETKIECEGKTCFFIRVSNPSLYTLRTVDSATYSRRNIMMSSPHVTGLIGTRR